MTDVISGLTDEDISTTWRTAEASLVDDDGTDADVDGTDGTDADGTDADVDGTDGTDADQSDS